MNFSTNVDKNLETALFSLLEQYSLEEVIYTLYKYSDLQARLAKLLEQPKATTKWQHQADALFIVSEILDEVNDDDDDTSFFAY